MSNGNGRPTIEELLANLEAARVDRAEAVATYKAAHGTLASRIKRGESTGNVALDILLVSKAEDFDGTLLSGLQQIEAEILKCVGQFALVVQMHQRCTRHVFIPRPGFENTYEYDAVPTLLVIHPKKPLGMNVARQAAIRASRSVALSHRFHLLEVKADGQHQFDWQDGDPKDKHLLVVGDDRVREWMLRWRFPGESGLGNYVMFWRMAKALERPEAVGPEITSQIARMRERAQQELGDLQDQHGEREKVVQAQASGDKTLTNLAGKIATTEATLEALKE